MSRGFWTRVQFPSVPPNKKRHIGRFFCFWWNRRVKQNPFPRPHFAFPIAAVMAEDKKAAALRLVLSACAQNGFFRECATTCSHLGALLFKFPSLYVSPFVRTFAELKRSALPLHRNARENTPPFLRRQAVFSCAEYSYKQLLTCYNSNA